jgi:Ca2+-binding RTX toxin-like protein
MNTKTRLSRLNLESLEQREVPAILPIVQPVGGVLSVYTNNADTTVTLYQVDKGFGVTFLDVYSDTQGFVGRFNPNSSLNPFTRVDVYGGNGNDKFINTGNLPVYFYGFAGNDTLIGGGGDDYLVGGTGRDVIKGMGGADTCDGSDGDDAIVGGDGSDYLWGQNGNDNIVGGAGTDRLYGGPGDDTLVTIDYGTTDYADGGAGRDTVWTDKMPAMPVPFQPQQWKYDAYTTPATEKVQAVEAFANGADRTLNGDTIADPVTGFGIGFGTLVNFAANPLFGPSGPVSDDVQLGSMWGDSWLLSPLQAMTVNNKHAIRQMVADFGDGTYGVKLGNNFYRVDADLWSYSGGPSMCFAQLGGLEGSLWVALIEKAYASYRTGANSYASLINGNPKDALNAYNTTLSVGEAQYTPTSSSSAILSNIYGCVQAKQACTLTFGSMPSSNGESYAVKDCKWDATRGKWVIYLFVLGGQVDMTLDELHGMIATHGPLWVTWGTF